MLLFTSTPSYQKRKEPFGVKRDTPTSKGFPLFTLPFGVRVRVRGMVKREYSFYPLTVCGVRGTNKSKRYGKESTGKGKRKAVLEVGGLGSGVRAKG